MLKTSILKTLSFFSLFDYPLTREEIFSYLWEMPNVGLEDFIKALGEMKAEGVLDEKYGYFFFTGNESLVEKRRAAVPVIEAKLRIARKAAKLISKVPFLKAIFVCNSLAFGSANENSDIDFFIIAKKGRIWLVRLFTNLILFLFGLRRHGNKVSDRVCLSFYVDDEHLDLAQLRVVDEDIYLAFWIMLLIPIYEEENYAMKILRTNKWLEAFLKVGEERIPLRQIKNGLFGQKFKKLIEEFWKGKYGNLLEEHAKRNQLQKIKISSAGKVRAANSSVMVEDWILKFHEKDIRMDVRNKWLDKIQKTI